MASLFLNAFGGDLNAVRRSVGATGGPPRTSGNNAINVEYVALSRKTMVEFRNFYLKDETDVANANGIKDFYTLNNAVTFSFGGTELDDDKYAIRKPLNELMSAARSCHDMYGFVAIYNPDIRADRRLRELRTAIENEETQAPSPYASAYASPLEMPDLLLAEADRLLRDSLARNRDALKRRIIGSDVEEAEGEPSTKHARTKPRGIITQNPRVSQFRNPGAVMRLTRPGAAAEEQTAGAAEIAYQNSQRAEQRRDSRRTLEETIIGLRNLKVVDIDDGDFYLEIDRASMTKRVVFARSDVARRSATEAATSDKQDLARTAVTGETIWIDPDVFVFVWPNRMPFNDGTLNTKFYEVIRRRKALDQADRNAGDVDFTLSHPTQYLEHVPLSAKLDADRLTNLQLYNANSSQLSAEAVESVRRDTFLNMQLQAMAAQQNGKQLADWATGIAEGRLANTLVDANGNPVYAEIIKLGYMPIPSGFKLATPVKPEIAFDSETLLFRFRRALSNALGVPMVLLDGGVSFSGRASKNSSGSTSAGASAASQAIGDSRLRNTILADRIILSLFMDNLWDIMYRQIDNETLETLMRNVATSVRDESETHLAEMRLIKKRLDTITETAELTRARADMETRWNEIQSAVARLRELSSRVRQIVAMEHRFVVEFNSLSFIPAAELAAAQGTAISKLDYANAIRANFGMRPLTQAEHDKIAEEILEERVGQMEAEAKVQQKFALPTGAGAGKKPKITKPPATGGPPRPK